MKISTYTGGFVQTNGYLLETPDGNILIDAPSGVAEWIARRGVRVDDVLLTHQHFDHVEDAAELRAGGARLHALEEYSTDLTLESLGFPVSVPPYRVDKRLVIGAPLLLAGLEFQLAHVPGHSTDSVTFYLADQGVVFPGDTLLAGSLGRTDFPGGGTTQLLDGIAKHLMTLPPATRVLPGHGPGTTIAIEAATNPYLD